MDEMFIVDKKRNNSLFNGEPKYLGIHPSVF